MDVNDNGLNVVVGGTCNDSGICGPSTPAPIIQLWYTLSSAVATIHWSVYIPPFAIGGTTYDYASVENVVFSFDNANVVAVLNIDATHPIVFFVISVSTGVITYVTTCSSYVGTSQY